MNFGKGVKTPNWSLICNLATFQSIHIRDMVLRWHCHSWFLSNILQSDIYIIINCRSADYSLHVPISYCILNIKIPKLYGSFIVGKVCCACNMYFPIFKNKISIVCPVQLSSVKLQSYFFYKLISAH